MRRNVRRLNREIGNHGSSLPAQTQVSLPLALPTSYQPRGEEKKLVNNLKTFADPDAPLTGTSSGSNAAAAQIEDAAQALTTMSASPMDVSQLPSSLVDGKSNFRVIFV